MPASAEHATPDTRSIIAVHGARAKEGGKAVVVLNMTQPATEDVTVQLSTVLTGSASRKDFDHFGEPRTVTFKAGEIRKSVEIAIAQDNIDEWTGQRFGLKLSNPDGALLGWKDSATVFIEDDDDSPEISIGDASVTEGGKVELSVELSRMSDYTIVAYWYTTDGTAEGGDYSGIDAPRLPDPITISPYSDPDVPYSHIDRSQTLVFNPGETRKVINIDTIQDGVAEGDESFTVALMLRHPTSGERFSGIHKVVLGSKHTATVTIVDDAPPVVEPRESEAVSGGTEAAETLEGTSGADTINGRGGDDTVRGLGGDDRLWGRMGKDILHGNAGDDYLWGGRGADTLHGGKGDDTLRGGTDGDELYGGRGADTLHGGRGKDILSGGHGRDVFVYEDADFGRDRIVDFEDGQDLLKFTGSGLQWSDLSVSNNGKGHAVVRVEGADSRIVLEGVDASLIGQDDFIF
ncbi:MAG: hypothetical protein OXL38_21445 [Gammaproteobacteria bacterium]|nr:hypothetical protein [Gammaproteobacteria bacterium]